MKFYYMGLDNKKYGTYINDFQQKEVPVHKSEVTEYETQEKMR